MHARTHAPMLMHKHALNMQLYKTSLSLVKDPPVGCMHILGGKLAVSIDPARSLFPVVSALPTHGCHPNKWVLYYTNIKLPVILSSAETNEFSEGDSKFVSAH